jgi:hypothetical protein
VTIWGWTARGDKVSDKVMDEVEQRRAGYPWGILPVNPLKETFDLGVVILEFAKLLRILKVAPEYDP